MLKFKQAGRLGQLAQKAADILKQTLAAQGLEATEAPTLTLKGAPETLITGLSSADEAGPGLLTFAVAPAYLEKALAAGAAAVIVTPALAEAAGDRPHLICAEPRLVFSIILGAFASNWRPEPWPGEAIVAERASLNLGPGVIIGAGAYIGPEVKIGPGTVIGPQACLEDGVRIGRDCRIHARAVLRWGVRVGDRCQIHSGAVIGDDGFGYTQLPLPAAGRLVHYKNEHLGGVLIEDDVEIGANATIDRGLVADTVIGRGSKIDNLVQIGHNCRIGRDCIVVSQVGIGGHTLVGDRAFLLGQVGIGPGVIIGPDVVLTGQAGVGSGKIPGGRRLWTGTPARPAEEANKTMALGASHLPRLRKFFQLFKKSSTFADLKAAFFAPEDEPKVDGE